MFFDKHYKKIAFLLSIADVCRPPPLNPLLQRKENFFQIILNFNNFFKNITGYFGLKKNILHNKNNLLFNDLVLKRSERKIPYFKLLIPS